MSKQFEIPTFIRLFTKRGVGGQFHVGEAVSLPRTTLTQLVQDGYLEKIKGPNYAFTQKAAELHKKITSTQNPLSTLPADARSALLSFGTGKKTRKR